MGETKMQPQGQVPSVGRGAGVRVDGSHVSARPSQHHQWHRFKLRRRLAGACGCAALAVLVTVGALYTSWGQAVDTLFMESVMSWESVLGEFARHMTGVVQIPIIVAVGIFVALVALVRRRLTLAGRALGMVVAANLTTQLLKVILDRPDLGVTTALNNSLPSGHMTIALSLCLALIVVAPQWLRGPSAWLGWCWASIIGITVMLQGWHRLADILVAAFICGAWALVLTPIERRKRHGLVMHRAMLICAVISLIVAFVLTAISVTGIDFVLVANPGASGYGFQAFLESQLWRSRFLAFGASLWVVGVIGLIIHEIDELSAQ